MPEAVWDGAVRRKLAVREAGTCRQHLQPRTRPPEQVSSVSWPSMRTIMKVAQLLDTQEQRLVLRWILLERTVGKPEQIFAAQKFHKQSRVVRKQQNMNRNFKTFMVYSVQIIIFWVLTSFSETSF